MEKDLLELLPTIFDINSRILTDIDELISICQSCPSVVIAVIPTVFDHVCERMNLNKLKTLEEIGSSIKSVNETVGDMYR